MLAPVISLLLLDFGHPLGPRVYDSEHWLRCQLPTERKDQQGGTFCCLFLETLELSLFIFLSLFGWLPECVHSSCPITLKVWYFWQLKSNAPPACYPQNASKRGKAPFLMAWWVGKVGIIVLPGSLLLQSICFTPWKCMEGELLELEAVFQFIPNIFISPDVVDHVRVCWRECELIHVI